MNIEKALADFGLNPNRIKIYMALLELKKATALVLSKKTDILRTTIYDNINYLKGLNLVSEVVEGKKLMYVAESPKNLNNLLKAREISLKNILPFLMKQYEKKKYEAKIKFYEGVEGVKKIHEEILKHRNETLYSVGNMEILSEYLPQSYTKDFVQKRTKLKIENKLILSEDNQRLYLNNNLLSEIENIKSFREVKILPNTINFEMFISLIKNKVIFFAKKEEGYCFIFESKSFSKTMLGIFNALWSISKPLNS